jgi:hypothetical protein
VDPRPPSCEPEQLFEDLLPFPVHAPRRLKHHRGKVKVRSYEPLLVLPVLVHLGVGLTRLGFRDVMNIERASDRNIDGEPSLCTTVGP